MLVSIDQSVGILFCDPNLRFYPAFEPPVFVGTDFFLRFSEFTPNLNHRLDNKCSNFEDTLPQCVNGFGGQFPVTSPLLSPSHFLSRGRQVDQRTPPRSPPIPRTNQALHDDTYERT